MTSSIDQTGSIGEPDVPAEEAEVSAVGVFMVLAVQTPVVLNLDNERPRRASVRHPAPRARPTRSPGQRGLRHRPHGCEHHRDLRVSVGRQLELLPSCDAVRQPRGRIPLARGFGHGIRNVARLDHQDAEKDCRYEFLARIEQNKAQERQTKEEKIQQVLAMWDGRVKWWEQKFEYAPGFKINAVVAADAAPIAGLPVHDGDAPRPVFGVAQNRPSAAPADPQAPLAPLPESSARQSQEHLDAAQSNTVRPHGGGGHPARAPVDSDNTSIAEPIRPSGDNLNALASRGIAPLYLRPNDATMKGDSSLDASPGAAAIEIKPWDPATPYLAAMKAVPADKAYGVFLEQRKTFGKSPAFYLDCGDYLERLGQHDLAVRVLTDVAALKIADARLLRVAAHRLGQIGERELAIDLFETVLTMRPEEPQSHRDLALALSDRADAIADLAKDSPGRDTGRIASDYARSLDLLNQVLVGRWDRFQEIELPCLMEANRIIARVNRMKQAGEIADVPVPLDPRLVKNLECDLRVVMTWDADNTDIDLWVIEPSGEKCFYQHNRTTIGGLLSKDFTDGYGPEEYCLCRLMAGKYAIQANFYGSRQQELTGPCTIAVTVYTDFGRPTEKKQSLSLRLVEAREVVDIGSVELGAKGGGGR